MAACGCMYTECAKAGFCIAQNPGKPIPGEPILQYWKEIPVSDVVKIDDSCFINKNNEHNED